MSTAVIIEETDSNTTFHNLKVVQLPRPVPKTNQALVKIGAAALNHREYWILRGQYGMNVEYNTIIGADAVGTVVELNGESPNLKVGDRVVLTPAVGWEKDPRGPEKEYSIRGASKAQGVFTQYRALDFSEIFKAPAHLTDAEAAALPLAGLTAYRALFTKGHVSKGHNVLITGIGGGVAVFALQFAVAAGANVYVTSSDDSKIARAKELGAKGGANYRKANWEDDLLKITGGQKIGVTIDGASGVGAEIIMNKVLAPGGIFVSYGQTGGDFTIGWGPIINNAEFRGSTMGSNAEFEQTLKFVEKHQIHPIVSKVWQGLEHAEEALHFLKNGAQFGKLVVAVQHDQE
ncbi:hypothetical protein BGZ70_009374 [Mortierella alpina]|uniref:Enoyl reductase (ER) domain-containing protein n=1 Tax=Mortierella alpina TaxID=64518 RepID=A0A9P6J1X2_MORAP|nr:hypothetical protein BGZ70_009374 [Mortierella alpina]